MEDNMQACYGRLPDEKMRQRMVELVAGCSAGCLASPGVLPPSSSRRFCHFDRSGEIAFVCCPRARPKQK